MGWMGDTVRENEFGRQGKKEKIKPLEKIKFIEEVKFKKLEPIEPIELGKGTYVDPLIFREAGQYKKVLGIKKK